MKNIAIQKM